MTTLRVRGWLTNGTIAVPPDAVAAMADLVADVRDLTAENARLSQHSAALSKLLTTIKTHGTQGDAFADAYREALAATKVE
jgi:hypothetical protein